MLNPGSYKTVATTSNPELFITKDIIEKHGGIVRAESGEGERISFTLIIPVPLP